VAVTLMVNGRRRRVDVERSTPLLWVIRESLGLTGTKFGCGLGVCGACAVHLDGQRVESCSIPVGDVGRRSVTTIEAMDGDVADAVKSSWLEAGASECGYCQPGQIISAIALLRDKRRPTDEDIDAAMRDHICRCGIYDRIRAAVHRAARSLEGA
jgi:isoquinoline 1-oxidoreductase alpha subunit